MEPSNLPTKIHSCNNTHTHFPSENSDSRVGKKTQFCGGERVPNFMSDDSDIFTLRLLVLFRDLGFYMDLHGMSWMMPWLKFHKFCCWLYRQCWGVKCRQFLLFKPPTGLFAGLGILKIFSPKPAVDLLICGGPTNESSTDWTWHRKTSESWGIQVQVVDASNQHHLANLGYPQTNSLGAFNGGVPQNGGFIRKKTHLVGGLNPSEKYESQLGWLFPTYGKIELMFQTTKNHQKS